MLFSRRKKMKLREAMGSFMKHHKLAGAGGGGDVCGCLDLSHLNFNELDSKGLKMW